MITETVTESSSGPLAQVLAVHPGLRKLFARPHVGFADGGAGRDSWVEYPNGMVTVILNMGEAFGGHPLAFVAGLTQSHDVIERDGPIECLDMKLTPPGARRLLGIPLEELSGSVVALRDVLGPVADEVVERVTLEPTWTGRARILDAALLRRDVDSDGVDPRIEWAGRCIASRHGQVDIRDLAREAGLSQRHFIGSFRRQLGLTPYKLARIARFNAVLPELRDAGGDGADLASRHGYADQSHLIREVREFTGATPTSLDGIVPHLSWG